MITRHSPQYYVPNSQPQLSIDTTFPEEYGAPFPAPSPSVSAESSSLASELQQHLQLGSPFTRQPLQSSRISSTVGGVDFVPTLTIPSGDSHYREIRPTPQTTTNLPTGSPHELATSETSKREEAGSSRSDFIRKLFV